MHWNWITLFCFICLSWQQNIKCLFDFIVNPNKSQKITDNNFLYSLNAVDLSNRLRSFSLPDFTSNCNVIQFKNIFHAFYSRRSFNNNCCYPNCDNESRLSPNIRLWLWPWHTSALSSREYYMCFFMVFYICSLFPLVLRNHMTISLFWFLNLFLFFFCFRFSTALLAREPKAKKKLLTV